MSVHPLFAGIIAAHGFRDRLPEPTWVEEDFTGRKCTVVLDEIPLKIGTRTLSLISGEAKIVGNGDGYEIEALWWVDHDTGAKVRTYPKYSGLSTQEDHAAKALVDALNEVAKDRLREML